MIASLFSSFSFRARQKIIARRKVLRFLLENFHPPLKTLSSSFPQMSRRMRQSKLDALNSIPSLTVNLHPDPLPTMSLKHRHHDHHSDLTPLISCDDF